MLNQHIMDGADNANAAPEAEENKADEKEIEALSTPQQQPQQDSFVHVYPPPTLSNHVDGDDLVPLEISQSSRKPAFRSFSDHSIAIQSNIDSYAQRHHKPAHFLSAHKSTSSEPALSYSSKSLPPIPNPHNASAQPLPPAAAAPHSKSPPQSRYHNHSKHHQYIVSGIQMIATVIHQHLTLSSSALHTKSSPSMSASMTAKQWQIHNFFQNLLKQFEYVRLSMPFHDNAICRFECIVPFCLVLEQTESPSSITAVSISVLTNLLNSPFIDVHAMNVDACIQLIGNTICSVTLDVERSEFDEALLIKFMHLITALLNNECHRFLSQDMVWNLFQKCLYIYFNVNANLHSEALFEFAEITLTLFVKRVFQRLPELVDRNVQKMERESRAPKQHNSAMAKKQKKKKAYISLKDKIVLNNNNNSGSSAAVADNNDRMTADSFSMTEYFGVVSVVSIFSALCSRNPESYFGGEVNLNEEIRSDDISEHDSNRLIICLSLILVAIRESGACFHKVPRLLAVIVDNLCFLLLNYGKSTKYIMVYELCLRTYVELAHALRGAIKLQNEMLFRMLFVRVLKNGLPMLLPAAMLSVEEASLFETEKVNDILLAQNSAQSDSADAVAAAVALHDDEKHAQYDMSTLSLRTHHGSMHMSHLREFDGMSTTSNASSTRSQRTTATSNGGAHDEGSSSSRIAGYGSGGGGTKMDDIFVKTCLEHLLDLCRSTWFIRELYLNYDCALYASNLCSDLVTLLSKHTIPGQAVLHNVHYLALQCLVTTVDALSQSRVVESPSLKPKRVLDVTEMRRIQQRKQSLLKGIEIFNNNPDKGVLFLYEEGLLGANVSRDIFTKTHNKKKNNNNSSAAAKQQHAALHNNISVLITPDIVDAVVDILFFCHTIHRAKIGYYLGEPHPLNEKIRTRYIWRRYNFSNLTLDHALRLFLEDFRLPIETQQIDRVIQAFSDQYCDQNNKSAADSGSNWSLSPSTTYTLCFALLMLHTNQHNKSIKRQKMTLEEFVDLIRRVKEAKHIELELLEQLYTSMTTQEMKLCDADNNGLAVNNRNISESSWALLIERNQALQQKSSYIDSVKMDTNACNGDILQIVFNPILTTLSMIFDVLKQTEEAKLHSVPREILKCFIPINNDELVNVILRGFYNMAHFICNEGDKDKMDLLVLNLCQLTGLQQVGNLKCGVNFSNSYCKKEVTHLLLNVLYEFAADCCTHKTWHCMLQIIMQCARLSLLPSSMYQLDDFVGGDLAGRPFNRSFKHLYAIDQQMVQLQIRRLQHSRAQQEATLFGTIAKFIDYLTNDEDEQTLRAKQEKERQLLKSAQIILQDYCKINLVIKKSSEFRVESVRCLIQTLIAQSNFGIVHRNNRNIKQNIQIISCHTTAAAASAGATSSSSQSTPSASYISNTGTASTHRARSPSSSLTNIAKDKVNRIKSSTIHRFSGTNHSKKQINYIFIDKLCNNVPVLQSSCLCVQFLTSILLHNWRRIDFIWDAIIAHFKLLLDTQHAIYQQVFNQPELDTELQQQQQQQEPSDRDAAGANANMNVDVNIDAGADAVVAVEGSNQPVPSYSLHDYEILHEAMVESAVVGILKVCVRGLQLPCNKQTQRILASLKLIANFSVNNFHHYRNVSYQITAALNRFIKQMCSKRSLFLKHLKKQKLQRNVSASSSSSSSSCEVLSSSSSSSSEINVLRSHHAHRLSDYQWWKVAPWKHIFIIVKLAAARYTTIDIAARIFFNMLGVFDDSDNAAPFSANQRQDDAQDIDALQYDSKLIFLPTHPELMDTVIEFFDMFACAEFHSDATLKGMMMKAICNVADELLFYRAIITNKYAAAAGGADRGSLQPLQKARREAVDNDAPGDVDNQQAINGKLRELIRVFIVYAVRMCASVSSVVRSKALLSMDYILIRSPKISNIFIADNPQFVKDVIKNVLCEQLIMIQLCSFHKQAATTTNHQQHIDNGRVDTNSLELITKSRIFAISLLNRFFLQNLDSLRSDREIRFDEIWMKVLCCTDIMLEMKSDPKYSELYTSIKQSIKNVLNVMLHKNILKLKPDESDRLSQNTWQKIDDMFPRMKEELFQSFNVSDYPHPTPTPIESAKNNDNNAQNNNVAAEIDSQEILLID